MAGNAIAKGNVLITADADQLNPGLKKSSRDIDKWAKDTGQKTTSSFMAGGKFAVGALAVGAAFQGVQALADGFSDLTQKMDATSKLASTLDMPTESLVGWQHAAELSNVSSEELSSALLKFRKSTTGPMDQALAGLTSKLDATKDAGTRAKILVDAFGKSGARLAPMFADGAKGIEAMKEEAARLGITFDAATGKQVEAANDAITRTKAAVKGMFQSTLTSFAPAIEKVAGFATKVIMHTKPIFDWIGRALNTYYTLWTSTLEAVGDFVSSVFSEISSMGSDIFGWTGELPTIQDVIVGVFRAIGVSAAYAWDTIKFGAGVVSLVAGTIIEEFGLVVNVFSKMISMLKDLPDELRPAGLDKFIEGIDKFDKDVVSTGRGLKDWGKGAMGGFGKSAEQFNTWLDKALEKKDKLSDPAKPLTVEDDFKSDTMKLTGALEKSSKEAFSLVVKNQFAEFMGDDTKKKHLKAAEKGNKLQEKGNKKLDEIAEALEDLDSV